MRKFTLIGFAILFLGVGLTNNVFAQYPEVYGTVYLLPDSIPMEGVVVQLIKPDNISPIFGEDTTDVNGSYSVTPSPFMLAHYQVHVEVPEGYSIQENDVSVRLRYGTVVEVNFYLESNSPPPLLAEIQGTVFVVPLPNVMEGVTVNLLDETQTLLQTTATNQDGFYSFSNLPAGDYYVQVIVPPDYTIDQNNVFETLVEGELSVINFTLYTPSYAGYAGSVWFWRIQFNGYSGAIYTPEQLTQFTQDIFDTFYLHPGYPIQVQGVTYEGNPPRALTFSEAQSLLNNNEPEVLTRAKRQYLCVLLNVVSGQLAQTDWVSFDQATASQGIIYVEEILEVVPNQAKIISWSMNNGNTLPAGIIPLSTPFVIYGDGLEAQLAVSEFEFRTPYPNPFNPRTTLQFTMAQSGEAQLTVYDVRGREVENIVSGFLSSGTHSFVFEANNLSAGVYFARLIVGNNIQTQKMLLVK